MRTLDRDLADALCVVIACGFMGKMTHVSGLPTDQFTDFIDGGGKDEDKYAALQGELRKAKIAVAFQAPPDKKVAPFIMAKTRKLTQTVQDGLQKDLQSWSTALETTVNKTVKGELWGAYLGGYSTVSKTEVLGVSDLYQYSPTYRTEDLATCGKNIGRSYEKAREVTNTVVDYLSLPHPFVEHYIHLVPEERKPVTAPYRPGCLFASVHGMTRAIQRNSPLRDADTHSVRFELALGQATNKVASCIPCSLLMAAVGQPATATHLGRGDNWNFPRGTDADIRKKWHDYVIECYDKGAGALKTLADKPLLDNWFRVWGGEEKTVLPEVFLEALTYESSFMDKLGRVLALW